MKNPRKHQNSSPVQCTHIPVHTVTSVERLTCEAVLDIVRPSGVVVETFNSADEAFLDMLCPEDTSGELLNNVFDMGLSLAVHCN